MAGKDKRRNRRPERGSHRSRLCPGGGVAAARCGSCRGETGSIELRADVVLRQCDRGEPIRESPWPIDLDGGGHTIRQTGYVYVDDGREQRQALAIDIDGFDPPEYDFLTFAGEEPPQIECNEDASGEGTDE